MSYSDFLKLSVGFILITFTFLIPSGTGKKCFSCTTVTNEKCLHLSKNESKLVDRDMIVNCKEFCTIRRQEYADDRGGVAWLNRSCESDYMDSVTANGYFILYLRSCKQNFCNAGDGLTTFGEIVEDFDDDIEVSNYTLESSAVPTLPNPFLSLLIYPTVFWVR